MLGEIITTALEAAQIFETANTVGTAAKTTFDAAKFAKITAGTAAVLTAAGTAMTGTAKLITACKHSNENSIGTSFSDRPRKKKD